MSIRHALTVLAALTLPALAVAPVSAATVHAPAAAVAHIYVAKKAPPPPYVLTSPDEADHWGQYFGSNGGGDTDPIPAPAAFTFPAPVKQVGTSNSTQYALLTDGTLWAWGQGTKGQLGNGTTADSLTTPVQVQFPPQADGSATLIQFIPTDAMPFDGGLAVDTAGNLWGWGYNLGGWLCDGTTQMQDQPEELTAFGTVSEVAAADEHLDVLDSAGVQFCGQGTDGVAGNGTKGKDYTSPVTVKGFAGATTSTVAALTESQDDAAILTTSGQVFTMGENSSGQLGNGTTTNADVPQQVNTGCDVTQMTQGGSAPANGQMLVMCSNGTLLAWGNDQWGQLGDGGTTNETLPVQFYAPAGVTYSILASGGATSYAIDTSGQVWAWGNGQYRQIGDGSTTAVNLAPVHVETINVPGGTPMISTTANDVALAA
jgi:alpha-tubulin suppressor-like RCC1 family protein